MITIVDPVTGDTLREISDPLRARVLREMIRYAVQTSITCPLRGTVLDVRTCVALVDASDDVLTVWSPEGYRDVAFPRWERVARQYPGVGVASARAASVAPVTP